MDQSGRALTVTRVHAIAYRAPSDGYPTRASKQSAKGNFIVKLEAAGGADGETLVGLGECQPRGGETGDRGDSWDFLLDCLRNLEGRTLVFGDRDTAVATVRALMDEFDSAALASVPQRVRSSLRRTLRGWARQLAGRGSRVAPPRPYRGTLLGLETALLDVAARSLDLSVAELLGVHSDKIPVAVPLPGVSEVEHNIALAKEAAATRRGKGDDEPLWLDLRGTLSPADAADFVQRVVQAISERQLPRHVIIEQPVRHQRRHQLAALQREADEASALSKRPGIDVRIMAGGSIWSEQGLKLVMARGGCGALNIRPAAVGGLLASIELVEKALQTKPDTRIHLSPVVGASEIATAVMRHLVVALPRADYYVDYDRAGEDAEYVTVPPGPGLGTRMPYETVVDRISMFETIPASDASGDGGRTPNVYDEIPFLQPLGPNGTKGHLLEREALAMGLATTRYSKGAFVATDGVHDPLLFKWSRSPLSSAVALALCTHKEATRMRLDRAGVPVPKGRTFANGDYGSARAFAERVGYPVVVKPVMGVRGIGVVANIQTQHELDLAFQQLKDSKLGNQDFIVEQHVTGRDYRIVVVGDEVIAAILREPGSVVGDGEHSVAELLVRKNLVRRLNPHLWGRPIKYDDAARYQLERAGLTLDSVPGQGQHVMLSTSCSLSQGGDSFDVLDELHPSIKEACVRAVRAIPGLAFCGVDFLLEDHTKPIDEQQAGVCELNAHAAIGNCEYPLYGQPREVARTFMQECIRRYDLATHPEHAERLALKLTVRGKVTGVGYRAWMQRRAEKFGVQGWVRNVNGRTVEAVLVGETAAASALAAAAILGPKDALPTSVTTVHVEPPDVSGFQIVHHAPRELVHVG